MVGHKCHLKTHVRNLGYPLCLQIGPVELSWVGWGDVITA